MTNTYLAVLIGGELDGKTLELDNAPWTLNVPVALDQRTHITGPLHGRPMKVATYRKVGTLDGNTRVRLYGINQQG